VQPPKHSLPEPLRANEVGTFAEDSVLRRLPETARRAIAENDLGEQRIGVVERLATEIASGVISEVDEPAAADAAAWVEYVRPYLGMAWVDVPWFFAETYFYRRLLSATGYSQLGERRGVDPFYWQKQTGLMATDGLALGLARAIDDPMILLAASLWANRVDLSLWPADADGSDARIDAVLGTTAASRLLADDRDRVIEALEDGGDVHLVLDNSGAELVADLALAVYVLGRRGRVTIHVKPHPTFVSDVTLPDLAATIEHIAGLPAPAGGMGRVLLDATGAGVVKPTTHPFWVSPLPFWQIPDDLAVQFRRADLVIVKGDANYRRLLGDLHWDPTTPFEDIVRPERPLVTLRASKSEVAAGLDQDAMNRARSADADWMFNGDWGMIQYAAPAG
jgi:hypothetical protein